MVTHFFTLQALAAELAPLIRGAVIGDAYTQVRNELMIPLGDDAAGRAVHISIEPKFNAFSLRDNVRRARKNTATLFPRLSGRNVESLSMEGADRTILLTAGGGIALACRLYDTAAANLFLVDAGGEVLEAFKRDSGFAGTIAARHGDVPVPEGAVFAAAMRAGTSALASLRAAVPVLGTLYARELLARARIPEHEKPETLDDQKIDRLEDELLGLLRDVRLRPEPQLITAAGGRRVFAVAPMRHLEGAEIRRFDSVNEGVRFTAAAMRRERTAALEADPLAARLRTERERVEQALEKSARAPRVDPADDERAGKIILAHLGEIAKGMTRARLTGDGGETVEIRLDPALSPKANADRYFARAKKGKAALPGEESRRADLARRRDKLAWFEERLGEGEEFVAAHREELRALGIIPEEAGKEAPPFRRFEVAGGFEVWVGRNSANNDLLTTKYARPRDLWFHVRGAGGSHTILRAKEEPPPKEAVRQAASIAAYYSRMRNAGTVPVAYCERKYVHKPRGAKEGAVVMERESVVFVKPRLPNSG